MSTVNANARTLRELHTPGRPLILANVWDAITARAVASLPDCRALATASYAVAEAAGVKDDDLTLADNLRAVKAVAAVAHETGKPLTADFQDGYGDELEAGIEQLVALGVAGINIEDADKTTGKLLPVVEGAARVKRAVDAAVKAGAPDFVVNARADALLLGSTIEDTIERGTAYLAAGAACIYVIANPKTGPMAREEVQQLVRAFDGRLNVGVVLKPGRLTVKDYAELGVARCSIGPQLMFAVPEAVKAKAQGYFEPGT